LIKSTVIDINEYYDDNTECITWTINPVSRPSVNSNVGASRNERKVRSQVAPFWLHEAVTYASLIVTRMRSRPKFKSHLTYAIQEHNTKDARESSVPDSPYKETSISHNLFSRLKTCNSSSIIYIYFNSIYICTYILFIQFIYAISRSEWNML